MINTGSAQDNCEAFAAEFDGPAIRSAMQYARDGVLTWEQVERLFTVALAEGLVQLREEATS